MNPNPARLALLAWAGLLAGVWAEEASLRMVEIEVRFVEMPAAPAGKAGVRSDQPDSPPPVPKYAFLRGVLLDSQTAEVLTKLKAARGKVTHVPRIATLSGKAGRIENVRALRFPIKYSEPETGSGRVSPLDFGVRNVGTIIHVEPKVFTDGAVELKMEIESSRLVKFEKFARLDGRMVKVNSDSVEGPGNSAAIWQPVLSQNQLQTTVSLSDGQTIWLTVSADLADSADDAEAHILITVKVLEES